MNAVVLRSDRLRQACRTAEMNESLSEVLVLQTKDRKAEAIRKRAEAFRYRRIAPGLTEYYNVYGLFVRSIYNVYGLNTSTVETDMTDGG